ncbi:MAG: cupredoxin domain-containing protein [Tepidiformaceae bacterium]
MKRRTVWLASVSAGGVLAIAGATAGCGGSAKPAASSDAGAITAFVIQVSDNKFTPAALTVPSGTTVKWVWSGKNAHSVVGNFGDTNVSTDKHKGAGSFLLSLGQHGTFTYQCGVHGAAMTGKIIVQ